MSELEKFDAWLEDTGPAALVLREHLMPVEGHDGIVFPATFAAGKETDFRGGYNIDILPEGKNVCLIDSVGSQANRIEPLFTKKGYAGLVPQIVVTAGDERVNLLEAGHRAADAIVRCTALQATLREAFLSVLKGNAEPLAKVAPTSLVFGAWDSRETQAKLPRIVSSTIRGYDVVPLTRSAQFVPAMQYVKAEVLAEPTDKKGKDAHSERGFAHVPSTGTPGGVIASGGVRRDAALHLAALRLLAAEGDDAVTLSLRRYVLGLALTSLTYPPTGFLRSGCNLVLDPDKPRELVVVHGDGRREDLSLVHDDVVVYAKAAAKAFKIGEDREVDFDKKFAAADVSDDKKKKGRAKKSE